MTYGILRYSIQTHFNEDGNLTGYTVSILGNDIYVEAPIRRFGDINGDGNVDVRDLVRLKKILAYITNDGRDFADLDNDGEIKTTDLAMLRRHLLGTLAIG